MTMVERTLLTGAEFGQLKKAFLVEKYSVETDEAYRVQYGDHTIVANGEIDIIFDDVRIEDYSFWVLRQDIPQSGLYGYTFSNGKWVQV